MHAILLGPAVAFSIFGLAVAYLVHWAVRRYKRNARAGYLSRNTLFSPAEWRFPDVLQDAVGGDYRIYAKVRPADLLDLHPWLFGRKRRTALKRILCKHVD